MTRLFGWNAQSPQLDLKAASWLPVYLVGMGAIVCLSDFGPMSSPVFPLWWDMVAVAIFSAVIYFWAMRSRSRPSGSRRWSATLSCRRKTTPLPLRASR